MSIFKSKKFTLFTKCSGIFFAALCCVLIMFPMHSHAGDQTTYSKTIYHKHTGSRDGGGGCYTQKKTGTTTVETQCKGTMVYWPNLGTSSCDTCGAAYNGDQSGRDCWTTYKEEVSTTYYELGCGKSTSTAVGTLTVVKDTEDWTKEVTLTASYEAKNMTVKSNPYIWNGGTATSENTYKVTANGTYTVRLNADQNANTTQGTVSVEVTNVDRMAPTVIVNYDRSANARSVELQLSAQDLQEGGSAGCGLAPLAYSFDGGSTWTDQSSYTVTENKTVSIAVRDLLDNINHLDEVVSNIDGTGPVITYTISPDTWTNQPVEINLAGNDLNADGSQGAGLAVDWYSLDGGNNWKSDSVLTVEENQELTVTARDIYDNRSEQTITVNNIDKEGPVIKTSVKKTGQKVKLTVTAEDAQSGLPENAYSWNKGKIYAAVTEKIVTQNGSYPVYVQDNVGNVSKKTIKVNLFPKPEKDDKPDTDDEPDPQPAPPAKTDPMPTPPETTEEETEEMTEEPESEEPDTTEEETESETTSEAESEETSEMETESETVILEERAKDADTIPVQKAVEKDNGPGRWLLLAAIIFVLMLLLLLALLFLWLYTIAVYVYDNTGEMKHLGRRLICRKEDHYRVHISEETIERCMTNRFCFCPSVLFVKLHEKEDMQFVFPNQVCISRQIEEKIEVSLL